MRDEHRPRFKAQSLVADASPYQMWRDEVVAGDVHRGFTYVWRWASEKFTGPFTVGDFILVRGNNEYAATPWQPPGYEKNWFEPYYHNGFAVPANVPLGNYEVWLQPPTVNNVKPPRVNTALTIKVVPAVRQGLTRVLAPSGSADETSRVESAFADATTVVLLPGEWRFNRAHPNIPDVQHPLYIPPGKTLRGYGAILRHEPSAKYFQPRFLYASDNITLVGCTFDFPSLFWWSGDTGRNVGFLDCTFRNGALGLSKSENSWLVNCKFERASFGPSGGGYYLNNCDFIGRCPVTHSFLMEGGRHTLGTNLRFKDTDRGLVLRSGWAECGDNLFFGVLFDGISWTPNGNELILIEGLGSGVNRNMLFRARAYNTEGQINFWDGAASNNLFWDIVLDRGGVIVSGIEIQENNRLVDLELRGGGIGFGTLASNNLVQRCGILGWMPSRVNQFYSAQEYYATYKDDPTLWKRKHPVYAYGPKAATNVIQELSITGVLKDNVAATGGVTVKDR